MNQTSVALMGAIAGLTIFLGLPVARLRSVTARAQGFLNAIATGVLLFLVVEILGHANESVESALSDLDRGALMPFALLIAVYVTGLCAGLLGLIWFNRVFARRLRGNGLAGPGAAVAAAAKPVPAARNLALTGLLVVGFALHNVTEGFGIAAPMASDADRPSWGFLATAGVIGGGPTFLGAVLGFNVVSSWAFVLFLALAAGALIYVINEMFGVCRRLGRPSLVGAGLLLGFLLAFGTELFLTFVGA